MRVTLISIQKPHTDNIFIHKKKSVEWRKAPLPKGPALCYETKNKGGVGRIVGSVEVVDTIKFDPKTQYVSHPELIADGCVPIDKLLEYADGEIIYANVLSRVRPFKKPRALGECKYACPDGVRSCKGCRHSDDSGMHCTPVARPPQSWMYVEVAEDFLR